jgi:hypothetical protein
LFTSLYRPPKSMCQHKTRKYDCHACYPRAFCDHGKRTRDCASCAQHTSHLRLQNTVPRTQINGVITSIMGCVVPSYIHAMGCLCPPDVKYRSSIVGCCRRYGCSFDRWACPVCLRKYRYRSWAAHHINTMHAYVTVGAQTSTL